jgi:hypothetical protein
MCPYRQDLLSSLSNSSQNPHSSLQFLSRINKAGTRVHQNPSGNWSHAAKPNGGFMKRNLTALSMMAVFGLMAGFACAGAGVGMRINVPFDFYLEDQLFPTGEYSIEMDSGNYATSSHLVIWSLKGTDTKMLFTSPGTERNATLNQLSFNKYGEKNFLSTVTIGGHKATLKMFKLEKELRSQMEKNPNIIAIAQK